MGCLKLFGLNFMNINYSKTFIKHCHQCFRYFFNFLKDLECFQFNTPLHSNIVCH